MKKLSFIIMAYMLALGLTQCKKNDDSLVTPLTTPLTLEALTDGTIKVYNPQIGMQYSLNGGAKTTMSGTTTIDVVVGDKVQLYGDSTSISSYNDNNYNGTQIADGTAQVKAYGNIMSLIDETGYATLTTLPNQDYVFYGLFSHNTTLSDASGLLLPAETLANSCYSEMFRDCTSLTTAPALPATTLADGCYSEMFFGCASLTTAPALPAETLAAECYYLMFSDCTSLTTAPALPATTLADYCYSSMFCGCTSLTTAPALPATTLSTGCYSDMFMDCTSLTAAPELPATTLTNECYYRMFSFCTSLAIAPALPATTLAGNCYSEMFRCTSLTTAPALPATALANGCYFYMFLDCTSLSSITCLATEGINQYSSTSSWVRGVPATGTFTKASGVTWPMGDNGIPYGWTVVEQ